MIAHVLIAAQFTGLVVFGIATVLIGIGAYGLLLKAHRTLLDRGWWK